MLSKSTRTSARVIRRFEGNQRTRTTQTTILAGEALLRLTTSLSKVYFILRAPTIQNTFDMSFEVHCLFEWLYACFGKGVHILMNRD